MFHVTVFMFFFFFTCSSNINYAIIFVMFFLIKFRLLIKKKIWCTVIRNAQNDITQHKTKMDVYAWEPYVKSESESNSQTEIKLVEVRTCSKVIFVNLASAYSGLGFLQSLPILFWSKLSLNKNRNAHHACLHQRKSPSGLQIGKPSR